MIENIAVEDKDIIKDKKYKTFHETFKYCTFALALSFIYPNKNNVRKRILLISIIIVVNAPMIILFIIYTIECLMKLDLFNSARNITLGTLISLYIFKFTYIIHKTNNYDFIFKSVSKDLLDANDMEKCCQEIYNMYIKIAKRAEISWVLIPFFLTAQFSLYAALCNIQRSFSSKDDTGPKAMVHDMDLKFLETKQYVSPYFELIFALNTSECLIIGFNFIAVDGSFGIVATHVCLKLKLLGHKINKIFKNSKDRDELEWKLKEVIKDHQAVILFFNITQEVFGGWLFIVFTVTANLIALNVYILNMIQQLHPKYVVFTISAVVQIYSPCYYSSQLTKASEDLSTEIYNVDWEVWADPVITKLLVFMIAKAQDPMILSGKGMVLFSMQLFISVLQTSYSFFTLISSN